MKLGLNSLRTRFIVAYIGLIVLGFGFVAGIAGQQLGDAVRGEYERHYVNQVELVAEALENLTISYYSGAIPEEEFEAVIAEYEAETGYQIQIYILLDENSNSFGQGSGGGSPSSRNTQLPPELSQFPEFQSATHDDITIDERTENEVAKFFTAAPINTRQGRIGYVQLSVPTSDLNQQIYSRWALLALSVVIVTLVALLASTWLSISLVKPLATLENFARQLAEGNLAYRVPELGTTELDEVGHSFNEMATQLEAMIEAQRAFASNTSHELRTPLTTMRLRTEALLHDSDLDDTIRQRYIEELDSELIRMSSLMQDLILLARFDAGRASLGEEQIDFYRFAQSTIKHFQAQADEKNIELQLTLPIESDTVASVQGSLNHLSIVFRNLLDNALKYTPENGQITWTVKLNGDWIMSTISDTGQGIDAEHVDHLFDRFFRGDKARSRKIQGIGLGLSLVKAIADIYGAKIDIISAGKDKGTTVVLQWKKMNVKEY